MITHRSAILSDQKLGNLRHAYCEADHGIVFREMFGRLSAHGSFQLVWTIVWGSVAFATSVVFLESQKSVKRAKTFRSNTLKDEGGKG